MVSMYGAEHHIIPLSSMIADSRRNISTREKIPTGGTSALTIGGIMSSHKILYVFLICALLTGGSLCDFWVCTAAVIDGKLPAGTRQAVAHRLAGESLGEL